ncbi:restriction endonuclease subunit S [Desulfovibrio sp. SGI.169]|uniref:restriction endonuclease subunit S n=1 Tax=Desulfovibrio sp. SGI.169 TaxID=3420561 RepID=UPI003CFC53AE
MIASEYGIIPQGWHYSIVGDLCKSISVTHKFDTDKLIFLNTGDIEDGRFLHENYMAVSEMPGQAKKSIARGDILFSEIRPINRHFAYVNFSAKDYVVSTKLMIIRATSLDSRRLYHFLTSQDVLMELQMQAESRSGTFPQIRFDNVSKLPILIADDKTEVAFTNLLHTVYAQIEHNNLENGKLRALRDNLLPRLMSGELDVSELDI